MLNRKLGESRGAIMFKHAAHMWICGAMVLAALVVVVITGKAAALLPALGCVAMMIVMMRMMGGGSGHASRGAGDEREAHHP
jgi:hypothetical protein